MSRGGVQSRLLDTASSKSKPSGAGTRGLAFEARFFFGCGLLGTSHIDASVTLGFSERWHCGKVCVVVLPAVSASIWKCADSTHASSRCFVPTTLSASFGFAARAFLIFGCASPPSAFSFFARGFRGLADFVSLVVGSIAGSFGSIGDGAASFSKYGEILGAGSRSSGSRAAALSLSAFGFRARGLGFGLEASAAGVTAACFLGFCLVAVTFVPSNEPLRDCAFCMCAVSSPSCCAKCSERTRLPTVANPLIASGGMDAFREPASDAPDVFFCGLTGGESDSRGDAGIATRRGEDLYGALSGEDGA